MRRTKIVCTIGPASESVEKLCQLIESGMNVARLNFSHGTHEEHGQRIKNIREAVKITNKSVAIMLDTKGPEIRTGLLQAGKITLETGSKITLTTEEIEGTKERISVNYSGLPQDVKPGNLILLDDGLIALRVLEVTGTEINCEILNGGDLSNRKGVNVPGVDIRLPAITEKDIADIKFGIEQGVDFIAASFIRSASDVLEIRKILEAHKADIHIISKIENQQGVVNIDEILEVSDGLMVARGDLGVEIPAEEVPLIQKMMIEKCNRAGKPVITATQMLDSMIRNPRPTRAEASDVANAILDGTDAIMLSGETAAGKYPIEAVQTMARIAERAESALNYENIVSLRGIVTRQTTTDAISHATCTTAHNLGAAAIITATESGSTARMVSKYRPKSKIIAVTPRATAQRKLLLVWGVEPIYAPETEGTDAMIEQSINTSLKAGLIKNGDLVVITAGVPVGVPGTTNLLKVEVVGQILAQGTGIGRGSVTGTVQVARSAQQAVTETGPDEILVVTATDAEYVPAMEKAAAVIAEEGGLTSHAAIVCLNLGKPVLVGVEKATEKLPTGTLITIDVVRGVVYRGRAKVM
ncbi:MAG: pyruvate kinase [Clostridia bacterium]|jgi:pyruvate kinase|nr:pyruvate kinase [Clostridia bacterium]MDN5323003.1 pyruvate kinase [Clostridia bacterium]